MKLLALSVIFAKTDLIFYRAFILKIGRKAGVDRGTYHLLGPCQRTLVHDLLARPGERERAQDVWRRGKKETGLLPPIKCGRLMQPR